MELYYFTAFAKETSQIGRMTLCVLPEKYGYPTRKPATPGTGDRLGYRRTSRRAHHHCAHAVVVFVVAPCSDPGPSGYPESW